MRKNKLGEQGSILSMLTSGRVSEVEVIDSQMELAVTGIINLAEQGKGDLGVGAHKQT